MNYYFTTFTISLLFLAATTKAQHNPIEQLAEQYVKKYNLPGVAIALIHPDKIELGTAGVQQLGAKDPIVAQSNFQLSSNSKAITSSIAASWVEKGKIQWTTSLYELFPSLKAEAHPSYTALNLQELLSHRSFLPAFEDSASPEWRKLPKMIEKASDPKFAFAQYILQFPPAKSEKGHHYSNAGYILAALMLEKVSGKNWEELVAIFCQEWGLQAQIGFPKAPNAFATNGHVQKGKKFKVQALKETEELPAYFAPAGNTSMSIEALAKFTQIHLSGLLKENEHFSKEDFEYLHYGLEDYSMGWYNGYIGETEKRFSYHGGSIGSYSSAVFLSRDHEIGVVILINADGKKVTEVKNLIREELWDTYK